MKNIIAIFGFCAVFLDFLSSASAYPVDCLLEVEGKTYIKGVCEFTSRDGGDFQIMGKAYFAQLNVEGKGKGSVTWNASPDSTHAQAYIGEVERKGACWISERVKVCARALSKARRAEIEATRPDGETIELIVAGYPNVCLSGHSFEHGTPLVLGSLSQCHNEFGQAPKLFKRSIDNILIDKHPGLCIDTKAGDKAKLSKLVLEDCNKVSNKWHLFKGMIHSSSQDLCWTLPDLNDQSKPWPINVLAGPCPDKMDEAHGMGFGFYNGE